MGFSPGTLSMASSDMNAVCSGAPAANTAGTKPTVSPKPSWMQPWSAYKLFKQRAAHPRLSVRQCESLRRLLLCALRGSLRHCIRVTFINLLKADSVLSPETEQRLCANLKRLLGRHLSESWALRLLLAHQAGGWRPFRSTSPRYLHCWTPPAAAASAWTSLSAEIGKGPLKDTADALRAVGLFFPLHSYVLCQKNYLLVQCDQIFCLGDGKLFGIIML